MKHAMQASVTAEITEIGIQWESGNTDFHIFIYFSEGLKSPTKFSYLVGFHPLLPSNVISSMAGKSDIACFDDLILSIHLIEVINGGSVNHNRSIDGFTLWLFNIAGLPGFTY
jgi:hypothetical protein